MANESRAGILSAISDWLKLLGLTVLVAEVVILAAMKLTPSDSPLAPWYPVFMLIFLVVVVIGVFVDRILGTRASGKRTLALGDAAEARVTIDTSQTVVTQRDLRRYQLEDYYIDSQQGLAFWTPKSEGWSEPEVLSKGDLLVRMGLLPNLDDWDEVKKPSYAVPLGAMLMEASNIILEHGKPLACELTDESSTSVADSVMEKLLSIAKEQGEEMDQEQITELRKQLVRGGVDVESLNISNCFVATVFDKALAQTSPVAANLGNVFLAHMMTTREAVERLVADSDSVMWGSHQTFTNIRVAGQLRELTVYRANLLVDGEDKCFGLSITFSPQTGSPMSVWEELRKMLDSFRVIAGQAKGDS